MSGKTANEKSYEKNLVQMWCPILHGLPTILSTQPGAAVPQFTLRPKYSSHFGLIKSASQLCSLQMHIAPILFPTSVRSKLHLHLLSNPDRPIAHTMKLGLASRSRFQGADRQPLSRFLHASQGCASDGSHRTWLMRQ